jgi:hypothetical protein
VAERIEASLQDPFRFDGHQEHVTASLGIAVSTGRESSPEDLLRNSDQAMYIAKQRGRARHEVFRAEAPAAQDEPAEPQAAGPPAGDALAVEELATDISVEEALVVERAEPPPAEEQAEPEPSPAGTYEDDAEAERFDEAEAVALGEPTAGEEDSLAGDEAGEPSEEQPDEGASALTEARRRRRMRFPPRR